MKTLSIYIGMIALLFSCGEFLEEEDRNLIGDGFLEFQSSSSDITVNVPELGARKQDSIVIQFGGATMDEPISLTWEIDTANTTAIQGVHYELISQLGELEVPAREHFASIKFDVLVDGFGTDPFGRDFDTTRQIAFNITGGDRDLLPDAIAHTYELYPWIEPTSIAFDTIFTAATVLVPDLGASRLDSIAVVYDGPTLDIPVGLTWEIDSENTTAVEGVHYELVSEEGDFEVPVGQHTAWIKFDVLVDGFGTDPFGLDLDIARQIVFNIIEGDAELVSDAISHTYELTPRIESASIDFETTSSEATVLVPNLGARVLDSITVVYDGPTIGIPLSATWEIDSENTTAVEGVHYELVSEAGTVEIPANEHSGAIKFNILVDGFGTDAFGTDLSVARQITFKFTGEDATSHTYQLNPELYSTFWTGPMTEFVYEGGGDAFLEANQDRLTDNVWIARGANRPIFNAAVESGFIIPDEGYASSISPEGTLWAIGSISDDVNSLSFGTFATIVRSGYGHLNNNGNAPLVVYLVQDNIFIDLVLTDWHRGTGADGGLGGFSYRRSTPAPAE